MKLDLLIEMPNMVSGLWRQFGVHVFEGRLTLADMVHIDEHAMAWRKTNTGKTVELVIVYPVPTDAMMTTEERKRMAHIIKRWENRRTASATVILATGLLGAMHRSVLTGLQLIAPPPHPVKVFSTTPSAVVWLLPHIRELHGPEPTVASVQEAVDELCNGFRARRALASGG
jgi:hypothetical protein